MRWLPFKRAHGTRLERTTKNRFFPKEFHRALLTKSEFHDREADRVSRNIYRKIDWLWFYRLWTRFIYPLVIGQFVETIDNKENYILTVVNYLCAWRVLILIDVTSRGNILVSRRPSATLAGYRIQRFHRISCTTTSKLKKSHTCCTTALLSSRAVLARFLIDNSDRSYGKPLWNVSYFILLVQRRTISRRPASFTLYPVRLHHVKRVLFFLRRFSSADAPCVFCNLSPIDSVMFLVHWPCQHHRQQLCRHNDGFLGDRQHTEYVGGLDSRALARFYVTDKCLRVSRR